MKALISYIVELPDIPIDDQADFARTAIGSGESEMYSWKDWDDDPEAEAIGREWMEQQRLGNLYGRNVL